MGIAGGTRTSVLTERNGAASAGAAGRPARQLGRRRSLPSGRAVVGGFLIALAALGTFVAARGTGGGPSHHYVVAAHDLLAGTTLEARDLRTEAVDLPDAIASRSFADPATLVGRVVTASVASGELVQSSIVVGGSAADPRPQVSLPVERARAVDGLLVPNEKVDVLVTYGSGSDGETFVVVRGAQVLRVDQGKSGTLTGNSDLVLVLALSSGDDVLAVTHASQVGKVTVVRTTAVGSETGADSYRPPSTKSG